MMLPVFFHGRAGFVRSVGIISMLGEVTCAMGKLSLHCQCYNVCVRFSVTGLSVCGLAFGVVETVRYIGIRWL